MKDLLEHWGISAEEAEKAGLSVVEDANAIHPSFAAGRAVQFLYHDLGAKPILVKGGAFARYRLINPPVPATFVKAKPQRYFQAPDTGVQIYFPRFLDWERIAKDTSVPIIITEGEAKAIVGCRLIPTIGLGGVFNFTDHAGLHPMLEQIDWRGRPVYIVFDSDAVLNSNVLAAESRLADELYIKRHAKLAVVRLPHGANDTKQGLDDLVKAQGISALDQLVKLATPLRFRDSAILQLNKHVVWVEHEARLWRRDKKQWLTKENFCTGSAYSSFTIAVPAASGRGAGVQRKSVAREWLTHPLASRVDEVLFRPGEPETVEGENTRLALNLWTPLQTTAGDIQPFLDLTDHLFSRSPIEVRDLPIKLMAYKAQNPAEKVPLCVVLIGGQGSGKSFWCEIVAEAFGPYGSTINPTDLYATFQPWLETTLLVFVNEMAPKDLHKSKETLKALISDLPRQMNEKYRPQRKINSYTQYIMTANDRGVGSFDWDDRRMVVIGTPAKLEKAFYDRIHDWRAAGGAKHLMHYFMTYPLGDWRPPSEPPMTQEKYIGYVESLTPVQRLAEDMRNADQNAVISWLDSAMDWANHNEVSPNLSVAGVARAILDNVRNYTVRPWYTPEELTNMFPAIAVQFMNQTTPYVSPGRLSQQLRNSGIDYLRNSDDERGFKIKGRIVQMLVVADFKRWDRPISQADFDDYMRQWPRYGDILKARRA